MKPKKSQHVWFARVGVVLFLVLLFSPASVSASGRALGMFLALALCAAYCWQERQLFLKSAEPSYADLLPKVMVPGLVVLLTPVIVLLR
jgi:hypothetical protein